MIDHYNAFISYKHGELDSKIAERVQHKLEHFHIPGKIVKRTGVKKITRIFRDKEELPITSNLTDTISYALEHSDYLIVICSTRTKLSTWVTREIKVFLETHPRNRVLTVLCDGEPGDVIPEELLYEEHEVTDENGTVHTVKVPLEPLSCDYRMSFRKADKEELPRLAAPIVGCSYDELMRRRRAYRIQRATAIGSVVLAAAVGFGFYSFQKKKEIQLHYEQALRNRAISLAWEADRLYDDQEVVKSLQLALASLPSEEDSEIPVTYDAIRAITRATGAYVPSTKATSFYPTWNYSMPGEIADFKLSADRTYLVGRDVIGNVICWDIATGEVKYSSTGGEYIDFYDDSTLVILASKTITAVDVEQGRVEWEFESEEDLFIKMLEFRDDYVYALSESEILKLDINDGKVAAACQYEDDNPLKKNYYGLAMASVSPDGKKIALGIRDNHLDHFIMIYDIESNSYIEGDNTFGYLMQMFWAGNDNLLYIPAEDEDIFDYFSPDQYFELTSCFHNMDPATAKDRWTVEFAYFSEKGTEGQFRYLSDQDALVYCKGFNMSIFDLKTGEELHSYIFNDDFLCTYLNEDTGSILFVSAEGDLGYTVEEEGKDAIRVIDTFTQNVSMAKMGKGIFVVKPHGKEITRFRNDRSDENWIDLCPKDDSPEIMTSFSCYIYEDELLITSYNAENSNLTLSIVDQNKGKIIDRYELDEAFSNLDQLVKVDDYCYIHKEVGGNSSIIKLDLKNGEVVSEFDLDTEGSFVKVVVEDEKFWYRSKTAEETALCSFDPTTEETERYDLDIDPHDIGEGFFVVDDGKKLVYDTKDGKVCVFDVKKGDTEVISSDKDFQLKTAYGNEDYIIIGNKLILKVIPLNQKRESYEINCAQLGPLTCCERDGMMFVIFENGLVGKYNVKDGSLIKTTSLFSDNNQARSLKIADFQYCDDKIVIGYGESTESYSAAFINIEEFTISETIPNYLNYHAATDRYYDVSYYSNEETGESGYKIGYFERYSVEDLVKKAKDILGGAELSEEDKARYGI